MCMSMQYDKNMKILRAVIINIFLYIDDTGLTMTNHIVRYQFRFDKHPLPKAPHGNSKGSTPYKRQWKSTRDNVENSC